MADEAFVSSREKSRAGYGSQGDPNASSLTPGTAVKRMTNDPKVAPPLGVDAALVAQRGEDQFKVEARTSAEPITPATGMRSRIAPGGPSVDHGVASPRPSSVSTATTKAAGDAMLNSAVGK
jgi:hypothetical protein